MSFNIYPYFTAIQQISVELQIWMLEVKELVELHNLRIHPVIIWSELKYLIAAKAVETIKLELQSGSNLAKNPQFDIQSGLQPGASHPVLFLRGF